MADLDGSPSVLDRVCRAAVSLLSLSGAGVSLIVDGELRGTAGVSESGVAAVQELQLLLGEGPCVDAWRLGEPVLEPDLTNGGLRRWPAFAKSALDSGVLAVFALPLALGAIRIGVLVLYRDQSGGLSADQLATGLLLAEAATQVILGLQAGAAPDQLHRLLASEPGHWSQIHRATGIVAAQLDVSLDQAFVRMRAHAFASGRPLGDIADEVIARRLRLEETP